MGHRGFQGPGKGPKRRKREQPPLDEFIRSLRSIKEAAEGGYRERSLKIHGLICAKCGREFDAATRHLLTVHHKDGNATNNPPDGSNWENLCVYCHEDEHSREKLGSYLNPKKPEER